MSLFQYLAASSATSAFRAAIDDFGRMGTPNECIAFDAGIPAIKIERTLTMIFCRHPQIEISHVEIDGISGCEYFRGHARVRTASTGFRIEFEWNCKWKALQLGWTDYFGLPDQTRAAQEFGFDCFRSWVARPEARLAG